MWDFQPRREPRPYSTWPSTYSCLSRAILALIDYSRFIYTINHSLPVPILVDGVHRLADYAQLVDRFSP